MTVRVFSCKACEHQMRLAGPRCGYCGTRKLFWQQPAIIILSALAIPVVLLAISF